MRARLLLISLFFPFRLMARTFRPPLRQLLPGRRNTLRSGTFPNLACGRRLDVRGSAGQSRAGDFRANMLAGEYWMGLYYLNRGDLPLACLEHMQHFSVTRPLHPVIRHRSMP